MKKTRFTLFTALVMLITSFLAARLIDATVQIDDDVWLIVTLLAALNVTIGALGYKLYRRTAGEQNSKTDPKSVDSGNSDEERA